jgi:hypothetical protein
MKEEEIEKVAYRIWLEAGQPDGDKLVEFGGKKILLKELHWHLAKVELTYGPDYLRSW